MLMVMKSCFRENPATLSALLLQRRLGLKRIRLDDVCQLLGKFDNVNND